MSNPSTPPTTRVSDEKAAHSEVERIASHDRVPGHEDYYEKNGLRSDGDGEDHNLEPPVSPDNSAFVPSLMCIVALIPSDDVFDCNGIPLDRIPNSCLYLRFVNSLLKLRV